MTDWASLTDQIIREAMGAGKFDELPGTGKPLALEDDSRVPEPMRMAHKVLRDNDLSPAWILDGKTLEAERPRLLDALRRVARQYRANGNAKTAAQWDRAQRVFKEAVLVYNRKVLSYNLSLPPGVSHRPLVNAAHEIQQALDSSS